MLIAPIQHLAACDLAEANAALVRWGHLMGPCRRPNAGIWAHGMYAHGEIVAVTITATLIRERAAGLSRNEAVELARLCAVRPYLCRVMLRLWREMVWPAYGRPWAISYQDEAHHTGATYRTDGWRRIGRSRSGTDPRSGRVGRVKTIWGWHADADMLKARAALVEMEGRDG